VYRVHGRYRRPREHCRREVGFVHAEDRSTSSTIETSSTWTSVQLEEPVAAASSDQRDTSDACKAHQEQAFNNDTNKHTCSYK